MMIGLLFGSFLGGRVNDRIGRKKTVILAYAGRSKIMYESEKWATVDDIYYDCQIPQLFKCLHPICLKVFNWIKVAQVSLAF